MLKKLAMTTIAAAAVLALGSAGATAGGDKASLNEYVYDVTSALTTMHVSSSDGDKWDTIEDGTLKFFAYMKIDTKWPGVVMDVGIVLGKCPVELCHVLPILWSNTVQDRDYNDQTYISVPTSLLSGTTLELSSERQKILATCNQQRSAFGATKRHEFQHSLSTTFIADTRKTWGRIIKEAGHDYLHHPGDIDHEKSGDFTFNVVCKPYVQTPDTSDLQQEEEEEFKTTGIDLFLKTFPNDTHQPTPGLNCPVVHVTTRVMANQAGLAGADRIAQIDGGAPETANLPISTSFHPEDDSYWGEQTQKYYLGPNTQAKFYARIQSGGVVTSTPWKSVTVQCKGPGGALATDTLPPEDVLPDAKYSGEITVADSALTPKNQCPRSGQTMFKINSNRSNAVDYKVDCTGGRSWQGTMQMFANGPGKFQGFGSENFDVDKTENVACVLKRVKGNQNFVLALSGKQFACADPAIPPATTDLAPDTNRPDDDIPQGQTLTGEFGFADHGAPKCPRTAKALVTFKSPKSDNIHWSLDCKFSSKSGVLSPQPNPAGGYMAVTLVPIEVNTTMDESCTLRTVAPYGPKNHVTKDHLFQCVTPAIPPATTDLSPETRPNGDTSRNPSVPVTLVPQAPDKQGVPSATSSDAAAKRLKAAREAAKKAAEDKRKRDAAAAVERARKLKAALERARAEAARKKAEVAAQAEARRKAAEAAAKLLQKRRVLKKRRTTSSSSADNGSVQQFKMLRLR